MQHAEFLHDRQGKRFHWQVTNWSAAVRVALGGRALLGFRIAQMLLLSPVVLLAVYSFAGKRPAFLLPAAFGWIAFRAGTTRPTGIGAAACLLIALGGAAAAMVLRDWKCL